jgi:lipid-A-disaccharide synthase-like uncharacterized protein
MSAFEALGWLGNGAFFLRFLIQWWASERAGRSVAPVSFFWFSLLGSASLGAYSVWRGEPVLVIGYLVNASIYARNLRLQRPRGEKQGLLSPAVLLPCAALAAALLFATGLAQLREGWGSSPGWLACVILGQGIWSSRFIVQWWSSERSGKSHFPVLFWWISLAGNALLLAYAAHLRDPVYLAGFSIGPVVQLRNLVLSARARPSPAAPEEPQGKGLNSGGVPE